jgi:thymidine kinase
MVRLEVIAGPMFSGKTEELIRRFKRATYADMKILVVKPKIDNRYSESRVVCREVKEGAGFIENASLPAIAVPNSWMIIELIRDNSPDLILIDEAQFFDLDLPYVVGLIMDSHVGSKLRIDIFGLDMDAKKKPFGPMGNLMVMANEVFKMTAVCFQCKMPGANLTQKLVSFNSQIDVGDFEKYEARCRACHTLPPE